MKKKKYVMCYCHNKKIIINCMQSVIDYYIEVKVSFVSMVFMINYEPSCEVNKCHSFSP